MKRSIKNSDLRAMSNEQREHALTELTQAATSQPNGELKDLESRIAAYEASHNLSSVALRGGLADGSVEETWDVCQWLILLDQRDLLRARSRAPRSSEA